MSENTRAEVERPEIQEAVASELFYLDWDEENGYALSNASNGNWDEQTDTQFREHYYRRARAVLRQVGAIVGIGL